MIAYGETVLLLWDYTSNTNINTIYTKTRLSQFFSLFGEALTSVIVTFAAEKCKRKNLLITSTILMAIAGLLFLKTDTYWELVLATMLSPSGKDVGPFKVIEDAALAQVTIKENRTFIFMAQNLASVSGIGLGVILGSILKNGHDPSLGIAQYKALFVSYILCAAYNLFVCTTLTNRIEFVHSKKAERDSGSSVTECGDGYEHESVGIKKRSLILMLCLFFGLDSISNGFYSEVWMKKIMESSTESVMVVMAISYLVHPVVEAASVIPSALLTMFAGPIAAIGISKAGSGLFTILIPTAGNTARLSTVNLLSELFGSLHNIPRQVYLASVTDGRDSTRTLGIVNIARTVAISIGPMITNKIVTASSANFCFYVVGALEIGFAGAVYMMFGRL